VVDSPGVSKDDLAMKHYQGFTPGQGLWLSLFIIDQDTDLSWVQTQINEDGICSVVVIQIAL
jgi:hypothetical protein